jgi:NTE family protein
LDPRDRSGEGKLRMFGNDQRIVLDGMTTSKPARLRVGLALGGGAARGFAHIGVIRTLAAAGYEIDAIAGTSIGAVIGACYAAGKLDEIEEWALSLTRRRVLGLLDFSVQGRGIIAGSRLGRLLNRDLGRLSIEELSLPFAAVATEIGTGHEIWLTKGSLVTALRASYALPGIFEPMLVGGRWLMDGALVNPVPVSTARAIGSRVVIAVNLSGEMTGRGGVVHSHGAHHSEHEGKKSSNPVVRGALGAATSLVKRQFGFSARPTASSHARSPGISAVIIDAFNVTQDRISRSRLAGDPPDHMITPRVGRIGLFEFHRAAEIIESGAEATRRALDQIRETTEALG